MRSSGGARRIDPAALAAAIRAEQRRRARMRAPRMPLMDAILLMTPTFESPLHLRSVVDLFERVARGEAVRACVSVPPRHAKTETILHAIAWLLARRPSTRVAYVSYGAALARSKSRRARDLVTDLGVPLRDDSHSLAEWMTIAGGGVVATGVGGPLTGHGFDLIVCDDPIKNREEADSGVCRESLWHWWTSTCMTRVEPGGSVIVVHTRWHRDDLIGRLVRDGWPYIRLPAINAHGEALWPARWPVDALQARRAEVGEYDWAALYQGEPTVRQGLVYAMFDPGKHVVAECSPSHVRRIVALDWGYSDPGVALVIGVTATRRIEVLEEVYRRNVLVAEDGWIGIVRDLVRKYGCERVVADPSEPGYLAAMRRAFGGWPVVEAANNAVSEGIRRVQVLLASGKLTFRDTCANLVRECQSYAYRQGPDGPTEVPQDGDDHCVDALRYGVMALTTGVGDEVRV